MNRKISAVFTFQAAAAALWLGAAPALRAQDKEAAKEKAAEGAESKIDPEAIALLNRAVEKLAGAKQFSVAAEIWQDVDLGDGLTVQGTKLVDIKVRRPDRAKVDVKTTVPKRSFFYDGKSFSLLDLEKDVYGTVAAPATLDETLTKLEDELGVDLPIDDLLLSRPFGDGASKATLAQYLGVEPVLGAVCHHLVFQNDAITWQAWVEEGPVAVIRKVAMAPRGEAADGPGLTAVLTGWDFQTELPDYVFAFSPPEGTLKVEFLAADETDGTEEPAAPAAK